MGYRLHLCEATFPRQVSLGEPFTIETTWADVGVAPIIAVPRGNRDPCRRYRLGWMAVLPRPD